MYLIFFARPKATVRFSFRFDPSSLASTRLDLFYFTWYVSPMSARYSIRFTFFFHISYVRAHSHVLLITQACLTRLIFRTRYKMLVTKRSIPRHYMCFKNKYTTNRPRFDTKFSKTSLTLRDESHSEY